MATWQFEFGFLPSTATTRHWASSHSSTRIPEPEKQGLWKGVDLPPSLVESLDKLLPGSQMISASHARWGDGDGSCIDVFFERDQLMDVAVTLDLRVPFLALVSELALIANQHQWLVIMTDGKIFRPTVRRLLAEIQHSPAMHWVRGSLDAFVRRQSEHRNDELRCD